LGIIRNGLICGVAVIAIGLIVLKIVQYIPLFSSWPYNTLITVYAAKILVSLSLLLVLNEILVTRHPIMMSGCWQHWGAL
jgi:hypothetical protein